jgi:hypothetical protein
LVIKILDTEPDPDSMNPDKLHCLVTQSDKTIGCWLQIEESDLKTVEETSSGRMKMMRKEKIN